MESVIVTGVVVTFLLLMLPAVIAPFLPRNPSRMNTIVHPTTDSVRDSDSDRDLGPHDPSERIAA